LISWRRYVIVDDTWFIIPGKKVRGMSNISLYPHNDGAKYARYREAWYLLRGGKDDGNRVDRIMACVEDADLWTSAANEVL
jgi:hypothetical protein